MFKKYFIILTFFFITSIIFIPIKIYAQSNLTSSLKSEEDNSHGEPIHFYWKKEEIYDHNRQTLTLIGGARVIRGDVTLDGDIIIGYLRKKENTAVPNTDITTSLADDEDAPKDKNNKFELYRVEARGHIHAFNSEDQVWGDHALYDIDKDVLLVTGRNLKASTAKDIITARDLIEYYPKKRIAIGRGNVILTTNDKKRISADIMEAFGLTDLQKKERDEQDLKNLIHAQKTKAPIPESVNKTDMDRAYGWGHVIVRTENQTITGNTGVYLFGPELARIVGHVHMTQGQNQNNGSQAIINLKTEVSTMLPDADSSIQGLAVSDDSSSK